MLGENKVKIRLNCPFLTQKVVQIGVLFLSAKALTLKKYIKKSYPGTFSQKNRELKKKFPRNYKDETAILGEGKKKIFPS